MISKGEIALEKSQVWHIAAGRNNIAEFSFYLTSGSLLVLFWSNFSLIPGLTNPPDREEILSIRLSRQTRTYESETRCIW